LEYALLSANEAISVAGLHYPRIAGLMLNKARTQSKMGRKKDALDTLEEALKRHPGYEHALNLKSLIGQERKDLKVQIEARYVTPRERILTDSNCLHPARG
jgi:tetratricopeptide (TPR) repeat protein